MTQGNVHAGLRIIAENPDQGFFVGPRPESLIAKAELALGGKLPPDYRQFVEKFGAGSFGSTEIYGVITEAFDGPVPDAVWVTLDERHRGSIPPDMIIVGDSGDGGYYCLQLGDDGPVRLLSPNGLSEVVAPNFGAYLVSRLAE